MSAKPDQTPQQAEGDGPRIYVACLAAYNNGHLHGRWIDATLVKDDIHKEIVTILAASPVRQAEEYAIHDFDGFEGTKIGEYCAIETVVKLAGFISEHGRLGGELLSYFGGDLEEAQTALDEYAGEYKSLADFAEELTGQTTQIPESLANYVDYAAMARDMELGGDVFTIELGFDVTHVFWSR